MKSTVGRRVGAEEGREASATPSMPSTPAKHSLERHFPLLNKSTTIAF